MKQGIILLVEDDKSYAQVLCAALEQTGLPVEARVARDGLEAMAYLKGEGLYANRSEHPLPILVVLDLGLPGMDGLELLRWIKRQPGLRLLRVVMLSASQNPRDSSAAYKLGVHSYLVKPTDLDEAVTMMGRLVTPLAMLEITPDLPPLPPTSEADDAST